MTRLSVNINKIATLRNARGGDNPNVLDVAKDCERYGADGITVHPRPDERHIRYADVYALKKIVTTEFNIEGNPLEASFIDLIMSVKPEQVTLVPDALGQLTSNHGWDTIQHQALLIKIIRPFREAGIRVSIFVDPVLEMVEAAVSTGADRVELYTESYAVNFEKNPVDAVSNFRKAAFRAHQLGLGVNAGHDLSLENLAYFKANVTPLDEVSIGHALICDALYYGLENTIQLYKRQLK
ncbi:MAG: pyridoxine 5'-phosphate synthase [Cytophagales bacterium]|nr:pyridoxine 5'-phosphate synthase [Cytophagales bacterium]